MIFIYMTRKLFRAILKPIILCINNSTAMLIEAINSFCWYRLKSLGDCFAKVIKRVSAVLTSVILCRTPKSLNEIQLTMKLRMENNPVTCLFYKLL